MKPDLTIFRDAQKQMTRPGSQVHWTRLIITIAVFIGLSFGLAALLSFIKSRLDINLLEFELLAYGSVFIATMVANATIVAPVPFAIAIMLSAARDFNPIIVALCAATGGTIGELSGYYAGRLGRKIAIPESIVGYQKVERWVNKYGFWAITVLAFQPVIPFDIGGMVAGVAKMPLYKFMPALWIGKFPKYIILLYVGLGIFNFLPSWITGG
jgi:uncharacterized membrane protein YdjX (TVP38/TMEM64 family)